MRFGCPPNKQEVDMMDYKWGDSTTFLIMLQNKISNKYNKPKQRNPLGNGNINPLKQVHVYLSFVQADAEFSSRY